MRITQLVDLRACELESIQQLVNHVYPVLEKNNEAAIYPPKAALQKSKIIISRARVVLKELTELGITKNISGEVIIEGDSKKLIFKF